jgi:hypothetical protein
LEEQRVVILNKYDYGIIINALYELRSKLIKENKSTEIVNELLIRMLDIPVRRKSIFKRERISNER